MPNELIATEPLVAQNFFLEIDGGVVSVLSGVSGLDMEVDVTTLTQVGAGGIKVIKKTLGNEIKAPDLTLTRMAPVDGKGDKLWTWFNQIRDKGLDAKGRKNGSVVVYNSLNVEIARYNFINAWPSKISTDAFSTDSGDVVKETITLVCERLERVK